MNENYIKGFADGWQEAVAEVQIKLYKRLATKGLSYEEKIAIQKIYKWLEDMYDNKPQQPGV